MAASLTAREAISSRSGQRALNDRSSCPAAAYHPGQLCKHSRKYFPQSMRQAGSIRPDTGSFKPFSLLPSEEKAAGVE